MLAAKLCGIVKLLRHIIYDRNKEDVKIQLLTSSKSG